MKFVHFCVGMKMDNHEKQQWGRFFGHVLKGLQSGLQSLNIIHVILLMSLCFFFLLSSSGEQYVGGG